MVKSNLKSPKKNSSQTRNTAKNSQKLQISERTIEYEGHQFVFSQVCTGSRSRTLALTQEEIATIPEKALINVGEPVEGDETRKKVAFWEPAMHNLRVTQDGEELRIFHTPRGPIMGRIKRETATDVALYSPCLLNINIQAGKAHYMPIAFAGFMFRIFKLHCMGESVPELEVALGYTQFVKHNEKGDYVLRLKGAYHHIDADIDPEAPIPYLALDQDIRGLNEGIAPSSDTREPGIIEHTRAQREALEAAETAATSGAST